MNVARWVDTHYFKRAQVSAMSRVGRTGGPPVTAIDLARPRLST